MIARTQLAAWFEPWRFTHPSWFASEKMLPYWPTLERMGRYACRAAYREWCLNFELTPVPNIEGMGRQEWFDGFPEEELPAWRLEMIKFLGLIVIASRPNFSSLWVHHAKQFLAIAEREEWKASLLLASRAAVSLSMDSEQGSSDLVLSDVTNGGRVECYGHMLMRHIVMTVEPLWWPRLEMQMPRVYREQVDEMQCVVSSDADIDSIMRFWQQAKTCVSEKLGFISKSEPSATKGSPN
jgi:hypothetical protein